MAGSEWSVGRRRVGRGQPCLVVAEIAQAHDGSLGTAHAYIDAVAGTGADAIKFQTHLAAEESTPAEPFRVKFSYQDKNRYDYWRRMEFTADQWRGLAQHAKDAGLIFMSTPFSIAAVELLTRVGVAIWKVGSGEISHIPLLERIAGEGQPTILSSGMSTWNELDAAVALLRAAGAPVGVLQCTTAYPCPPENVGLNVVAELRERYGVPVGLSDHSGTPFPGLAAVSLGANILEVHVVMSRESFGPDVKASVTTEELGELVRGVRFIERALQHSVSKEQLSPELAALKELFGKSIVAARDLSEGQLIEAEDLAYKKPGTGLPPSRASALIGRRLNRSVAINALIEEAFLD